MVWDAGYWQRFADEARITGSPLYGDLAEGVAGDTDLLALATSGKPNQPPANMLFAAVHYLLIRGADHPLRRFYPDLGGGETGDPMPTFKDFIACHRDEIAALILTRAVNTCEVNRCTLLAPAFRTIAGIAGAPLHLIEIGPSAGLNLNWDRYGVRYVRDGEVAATLNPDALPMLECDLRGDALPPAGAAPDVAARVGLELHPVDVARPEDRDWLTALIWPGRPERFDRLARALEVAIAHPPDIRGGDALDSLPEAMAEARPDHTLVVFHTKAVYQFTQEMCAALDYLLIAVSLRRPLYRLGLEMAADKTHPLELHAYRDGRHTAETLALCQPHGNWMDWRKCAGI